MRDPIRLFAWLVVGAFLASVIQDKIEYSGLELDAIVQGQAAEIAWLKMDRVGLLCFAGSVSWQSVPKIEVHGHELGRITADGRYFIAGQQVSKEEWREFLESREGKRWAEVSGNTSWSGGSISTGFEQHVLGKGKKR